MSTVIFSVFVSPSSRPSTFFSFTSKENVPSLLFEIVCEMDASPVLMVIWEEDSVGLLASIVTSMSFCCCCCCCCSSSDDSFLDVSWCTFALKRVTGSSIFSFSTFSCSSLPRDASSSSASFFTNSTSPSK